MDPHFLFNNLNTLTALIPVDHANAVKFTQKLSSVYRHTSQYAHQELVTLQQELKFIQDYFDLLSYRFGEAYRLDLEIGNIDAEGILMIPMALQTTTENVVKHNAASKSNPLVIEISIQNEYIEVRNELRLKKVDTLHKTGLGLENLKDQYTLLTDKPMEVEKTAQYFTVKLPIIKHVQ